MNKNVNILLKSFEAICNELDSIRAGIEILNYSNIDYDEFDNALELFIEQIQLMESKSTYISALITELQGH